MDKYELTLEQIHNIIESYKLGEFCEDNCYGCYGDNSYSSHCQFCNPKLKTYLENIEKEKEKELEIKKI